MQQVHLLISGKVQGVWYRVFVQKNARELGLTGWVRNTDEGHVEAMVQGNKDAIESLIKLCRQGPPLAEVKEVVHTKFSSDEIFIGFRIR